MTKTKANDVPPNVEIIEGTGRFLPLPSVRKGSVAAMAKVFTHFCSDCGARYYTPNMRGRCINCILDGLVLPAHIRPFEYHERGSTFGKQYNALGLVAFGITHAPNTRVESCAPLLIGDDGHINELRHVEVFWLPSEVYLEARWDAQAPAQIAIVNFERAQEQDSKRAWQAKRLVTTFANAGRPTLSEAEIEEHRGIVRKAEEIKRKYPRLNWGDIAAQLGYPVDTLKKWRKDDSAK